tara:strand:+ start:2368 stop:2769 length:402 start_codon:yes stop_codon:yes gene_type:complete
VAKKPSKQVILDAIKGTGGIMVTIAKRLRCARSTAVIWIDSYEETKKAYKDEVDSVVDLAEMGFIECLKEKQSWAIKLMLTTKGAERGYIERKEHNIHLQPFTHIEIEQKFDDYEEVKPEDNGDIQQKLNGKE